MAAGVMLAWLAGTATDTFGQQGQPGGAFQPHPTSANPLWVTTLPLDDARQVLLVVDPSLKCVVVYHVDLASGTLTLKSSRDISADLHIGDFNAQEPKPAALRKMLEMKGSAPAPR